MDEAIPIIIRKSPVAWMGDNLATEQEFQNIAEAHKYAQQNFKVTTYLYCKDDDELMATVWYSGELEYAHAGSLVWHIQCLVLEIEELRQKQE